MTNLDYCDFNYKSSMGRLEAVASNSDTFFVLCRVKMCIVPNQSRYYLGHENREGRVLWTD